MDDPTAQPPVKIEYFISRAGADAELAKFIAQIVRETGGEPYYQDEHFGHADFMHKMEEGYARMARMISLLSPEYQTSEYCCAEYNNVLGKDPANMRQRLVVLRVANYQPYGNLQNLAYTDLVPVITDAAAVRRLVRVALGFDTKSDEVAFWQAHRRAGQQIIHPEIRPVRGFTGRDEMLKALANKLWHGSATVAIRDTGEASVALRGLGGVGKTVLAKQYAWENREKYYGLWWIRADKHETLIDDLVALGARFIPGLDTREPKKTALLTLQQIAQTPAGKPWLLIYDNVDDQDAIRTLTPADNAHVLITSRLTQWLDVADDLEVGVFDRETAINFLVSRLPHKDRAAVGHLADALGRLPLALGHARAYCAERNWTFDQYAARVPELIRHKPNNAAYPDAVFATFSLAIDKAAGDCADAERVLGLLTFFAPDQVPLWLVSTGYLPEERRDDALAALNRVSLVTLENLPDGTPAVSVHRLVQEVMRGRLSDAGHAAELAADATQLVRFGYDDEGSFEGAGRNAQLLAHALAVLAYAPRDGSRAEHTLWVMLQTGDFRLSRGESSAALAAYHDGRDLADHLAQADPGNGVWQRDLAVSHNKIGDVQRDQGKLAAALASYHASLAIIDRLAQAHPGNAVWQRDLAVSHNRMGDVQRDHGNLGAALASYKASLAVVDRLAHADPGNARSQLDLSISHEKIGDVEWDQGNRAAALASYQAVLAIRELLAKTNPRNAEWQRALSVSHTRLGNILVESDLRTALDHYNADLAIAARLAQADPENAEWQRDLAVSHSKIGDVLVKEGNLPVALASFQASLGIMDRLAQADPGNAGWQRGVAISNERVGDVNARLGEKDEAIAAFQRALDTYRILVARQPDDVQSLVFSVVPLWRLGRMRGGAGRTDLEAALAILKPLAVADRLDVQRLSWIGEIEAEIAVL